MIKLISTVRVDADRQVRPYERELGRGKGFTLYMNDVHLKRKTSYHKELLGLATNGKAYDWDTLAKAYASKLVPQIQDFARNNTPIDDPDRTPYGTAFIVGCGCLITFDGSEYDTPNFRYGVVAKCKIAVAYRTDDRDGGTLSVATLDKQREKAGKKTSGRQPLVVIADTGIIDVQPVSSIQDMDRQIRFTPSTAYTAGDGNGSMWAKPICTKNMTDREFWEFLGIARKTQFADTTDIKDKFKSARWLVSDDAATLEISYNDTDFDTRQQTIQSLAKALWFGYKPSQQC